MIIHSQPYSHVQDTLTRMSKRRAVSEPEAQEVARNPSLLQEGQELNPATEGHGKQRKTDPTSTHMRSSAITTGLSSSSSSGSGSSCINGNTSDPAAAAEEDHDRRAPDPRRSGSKGDKAAKARGFDRRLFDRVPYFAQTSKLSCGPACLRMIAASFGTDPGVDTVEHAAGLVEGKVITTLELALAAGKLLPRDRAEIAFCSTCPGFNEANMRHVYYQRYNAASVETSEQKLVEAQAAGVRVEQRSVALSEITEWLSCSTLTAPRMILALLDWSIVAGRAQVPSSSFPSCVTVSYRGSTWTHPALPVHAPGLVLRSLRGHCRSRRWPNLLP